MSLEKHFGFINHPFPIEENAKFFYFSKKLRTDFERFLYTLRLESGIFYIIGAHATGRSYFLNALGKHISVNDLFIKLNPKQKGYSLISDICSILNLKEKTLETLNGYLKSVQKTGINVVIAIDSVKDINNEQLKILSELYRINNKIKILLLVEKYTKFYNRLKDNNINNLREKPVYISKISPFSLNETFKYVNFQINEASVKKSKRPIISDFALAITHLIASGRVKYINTILNKALNIAYKTGAKKIKLGHIIKGAKEAKEVDTSLFIRNTIIVVSFFLTIFIAYNLYLMYEDYQYKQKVKSFTERMEKKTDNIDPTSQEMKEVVEGNQPTSKETKPKQQTQPDK